MSGTDCMVIIVVFSAILAIKTCIERFVFMNNGPSIPPGPKPAMSDILSEVSMIIKLECIGVIDIPQSVKNIPLITDFENIQKEIIHNVLESFSTQFWQNCNRAGLKRQYIITYVTRKTHAEILSFINEHNYATSPSEPVIHTNNEQGE